MSGTSGMRWTGRGAKGFTILELLVSVAILAIILVLTFSLVSQTGSVWKKTAGKITSFQEARAAFEAVTRKLSQSTLNTYWDYVDAGGNGPGSASYAGPNTYARQSELHFLSGPASGLLAGSNVSHAVFFQAPLGYSLTSSTDTRLSNRMVTSGFFIQYGPESNRPNFIGALSPVAGRNRFRLMQVYQPTESLAVYNKSAGTANVESSSAATRNKWFVEAIGANPSAARPFAENILALVLMPRRAEDALNTSSLTTNYTYDTKAYNSLSGSARISDPARNQLPPLVQVTMVAVDEESAARLDRDYPSFAAMPSQIKNLFAAVSNYQSDLEALEGFLQSRRYNYRIFSTTVSIRQAKWSEQ